MRTPAIIVHGGAGWIQDSVWPDYQRGTQAAARAGQAVLDAGAGALDAVCAACVALENDQCFNAGYGSSLTVEGAIENDAFLMTDDMRVGAVGCLSGVRNPILAARLVMEQTEHCLIVGAGAHALAQRHGLELCDWRELIVERRLKQWEQLKAQGRSYGESLVLESMEEQPAAGGASGGGLSHRNAAGLTATEVASTGESEPRDTIGALALDCRGGLAAALSTGGVMLKLPGRLGDTPVPGGGAYCGPAGAVCATGHGEAAMRVCLAKYIYDRLEAGADALSAALAGVKYLVERVDGKAGVIVLDRQGRRAWATSTTRISAGIPERLLADAPSGTA